MVIPHLISVISVHLQSLSQRFGDACGTLGFSLWPGRPVLTPGSSRLGSDSDGLGRGPGTWVLSFPGDSQMLLKGWGFGFSCQAFSYTLYSSCSSL